VKRELALAAVATVVALLVVEGALRVFGITPYGALQQMGDTPLRTVDGVVLWEDRTPRATREDVARAAARSDAFVVLGLGDSIMYGVGLAKEDTYLEQTRRLLANRTARAVEVLNLAVPGYNTAQEDAVHRELGGRPAANVVLLHYWSDDAHTYRAIGGYIVDFGDLSADGRVVVRVLPVAPALNDALLLHSRLYQLVTQAVLAYDRRAVRTDPERVARPLAALNARVREGGGRLVVLASPDLAGAAARPNAELAMLRQWGTAQGFEVVDPTPWLAGTPAAAIRLDDCHFNAAGHQRVAEGLAAYLLAHDLASNSR
jgi:lysophospholipase L1-like esterase